VTRSIVDALAAPTPPGACSDGAERLVGGLATQILTSIRARAASDLEVLGAGQATSPALVGIRARFVGVAWQLLGTHAADQSRIWRACRPGSGVGWAREDAVWSANFATYMQDEGWAALLDRLPSLEALVRSVVRLELDATALLLWRAARDADALGRRFGVGGDAGSLTEARLGLSDPHNGRQTVAALGFAGGMHVIYKPRPVAMEQGFSSTLEWLRRRAQLDVPAGIDVLAGDGYGWCEFVQWRPCARREEVDLYFRRLGALAGILASLAATDCHAENFVARGPEPVMVDADTLLHPRMMASPGFSVLETEILPSQVPGPAGQSIDYPGFDAQTSAVTPSGPVLANLPGWDGRPQRLRDHRAKFDEGLDATRRTLRAVGGQLTGAKGPLGALSHRLARVVLRPTSVYGVLLAHLQSASALGSDDGGFARVERELMRYQDPILSPDAWRAVRRAEIAALARADVPYFLADTATGALETVDGSLLAGAAVKPVLGELPAVISQIADGSIR
jgi:hypothetical protein